MASPLVSGLTPLRSPNFAQDSTNLSISGGSATITNLSSSGFWLGAVANNINYKVFVGFNLTGPIDFTGLELYISGLFNLNIGAVSPGFSLGLRDTSGRERTRLLHSNQTFKFQTSNYLMSFDDGSGTFTQDPGFDIKNVAGLVLSLRFSNVTSSPNGNQTGITFYQIGFIDSGQGLLLTGGEPGNLADIADLIDYFGTIQAIDNVAYGLYKDLENQFLLGFTSLTIEDANLANTGGAILFRGRRQLPNQSWLVYQARTITINTASPQTIGFQIKGAEGFLFRDIGASNLYQGIPINGYVGALLGDSDYLRVEFLGSGPATGGRRLTSCSFLPSTAEIAYEWNGSANLEACEFAGGQDYFILIGSLVSAGAVLDCSTLTFGDPGIAHILVDGVAVTIALSAAQFASYNLDPATFPVSAINGGSFAIVGPVSQILLTGIPTVPGALVGVLNLATLAQTFPAVAGGTATIPTDPAANYLIAVDAPGYQLQRVVLAGSTPSFEMELENNRDLYEAGVSISANLLFDYDTFEVTFLWAAGVVFSNANIYRTIEDYLATPQGVFFPNPPRPIRVPGRNFLFFPYDQAAGQVNPVRVRPHPANQGNPRITDVVVILEGAENPQTDIFDFSLAGGKTIFYQTDATVAIVSGGGAGLGPDDIARLERIENQLIADESKGATRYKRFLPGTQTVILDKDVTFDPIEGFTIVQHEEPTP